MESLEKAERLKNELDGLRPFDAETEARIMQKFRLDWNYHSNNLEGNSLTYGETKALILFGITAQGKPLKDHFEITGHNEAINWIMEVVKDETPLTEKFIRELHTLLLKETSYKEAKTPEGKQTRRKIEVGRYKTQPNHVVTVTGETFYFATPEETPSKMHDLIEWFRKEKEKTDVNPIILAALFHYRFIRIHPFDDGNGRVARILMNFILMQFGYPPAIIKTDDKENYYAVLHLADADELEPFIEYITANLVRSLEIMIKGARGEDIEEPDDLDKELALLERKFRGVGNKIEIARTEEVLSNFFNDSFLPITLKFIENCEKFERFYAQSSFSISLNESTIYQGKSSFLTNRKSISLNFRKSNYAGLYFGYSALNQVGLETNNFSSSIRFEFSLTKYKIFIGDIRKPNYLLENIYSEKISEDEINKIMKVITKIHKDFIERKVEEFNQLDKGKQSLSDLLK
jgi:Fic family protein